LIGPRLHHASFDASDLAGHLHSCHADVGSLSSDMKKKSVVKRDPEILGGTPCFAGTRVPVRALLDYMEGGDTLDEFLEQYPTVSRKLAVGFLEESANAIVGKALLPECAFSLTNAFPKAWHLGRILTLPPFGVPRLRGFLEQGSPDRLKAGLRTGQGLGLRRGLCQAQSQDIADTLNSRHR